MVSKHLAQGRVEDVGGGVIAFGCPAGLFINVERHGLPFCNLTGDHFSPVDDQALGVLDCIGHFHFKTVGSNRPGIAGLTAGLTVERSSPGYHFHRSR